MNEKKLFEYMEARKESLLKKIVAETIADTLTLAKANALAGALSEVLKVLRKDYDKGELNNIIDKMLKPNNT